MMLDEKTREIKKNVLMKVKKKETSLVKPILPGNPGGLWPNTKECLRRLE